MIINHLYEIKSLVNTHKPCPRLRGKFNRIRGKRPFE